jgi:hypothetical protein
MEIGTEQFQESTDELRTVTSSGRIYVQFGRIVEVIGVWLKTDISRTTNLAINGSHDKISVKLDVIQPAGTEVLVSYVSRDGLNDETAETVIEWGLSEVLAEIQNFGLDLYSPKTPLERLARVYWQMLSLYNAYLLMNNVNFIQSDGNISLFNYSQMSKLWGEGMGTEALFKQLRERLEVVRRGVFILSTTSDIYAGPQFEVYWRDENILKDWVYNVDSAHRSTYNDRWRVG